MKVIVKKQWAQTDSWLIDVELQDEKVKVLFAKEGICINREWIDKEKKFFTIEPEGISEDLIGICEDFSFSDDKDAAKCAIEDVRGLLVKCDIEQLLELPQITDDEKEQLKKLLPKKQARQTETLQNSAEIDEDQELNEIATKLQNMPNGQRTLNVHIPGTCGHCDKPWATYVALSDLEKSSQKSAHAIIYFEGVGAKEEKGHIAPIRTDTKSVAGKKSSYSFGSSKFFWRELGNRLKKFFTFGITSDSSDFVAPLSKFQSQSDNLVRAGGIVFGVGDEVNIERILYALKKLKGNGQLPDKIILSGHSRGAVNVIKMANRIFARFPSIKIHIVLTDPVPGPLKDSWDNKTIPPSVETFSVVYAGEEKRKPMVANHIAKLRFVNPNTIISSFVVKKDHKDIAYGKNVCLAVKKIIFALNGKEELSTSWEAPDYKSREEMISDLKTNERRKDHHYLCVTELPKNLDELTKKVIEEVRGVLDPEYKTAGHLKSFGYTKNPFPAILKSMQEMIGKLNEFNCKDNYLTQGKIAEIIDVAKKLKDDVQHLESNGKLKEEWIKRFESFYDTYKEIFSRYKGNEKILPKIKMTMGFFPSNAPHQYASLLETMKQILKLAEIQKIFDRESKLRLLVAKVGEYLKTGSMTPQARGDVNERLSELVSLLNNYVGQAYNLNKTSEQLAANLENTKEQFKLNLKNWILDSKKIFLEYKIYSIKSVGNLFEHISSFLEKSRKNQNQRSSTISGFGFTYSTNSSLKH